MKSYFIDTSVIIDYIKGKERTGKLINTLDGDLTSSYFCLAELYEGIERVKNRDFHEKAALEYFGGLSEVHGLNLEIVKKFGSLRAKLKQQGNIIEDIDLFIAATCLVYDLILVTYNKKHFSRVPDLKML